VLLNKPQTKNKNKIQQSILKAPITTSASFPEDISSKYQQEL
jgi:hypothetical protein